MILGLLESNLNSSYSSILKLFLKKIALEKLAYKQNLVKKKEKINTNVDGTYFFFPVKCEKTSKIPTEPTLFFVLVLLSGNR